MHLVGRRTGLTVVPAHDQHALAAAHSDADDDVAVREDPADARYRRQLPEGGRVGQANRVLPARQGARMRQLLQGQAWCTRPHQRYVVQGTSTGSPKHTG